MLTNRPVSILFGFPVFSIRKRNVCMKMLLLDKVKALLRDQSVVGFQLNASQVQILREPSEFYETLLKKCKTVEKRIVVASLYLGTGSLEARFLSAISSRLEERPKLSVRVLLDCMRGSRGEENSRTMLLPLLKRHPDSIRVNLYHTPMCRGFLKMVLPSRYNEIVGLQHMKLYLFDDDLIITGANLSSDYFTHRQDRYLIVNKCRSLADFAADLCSRVSDFSFKMDRNNQLAMGPHWPSHPVQSKLNDFVRDAKNHVLEFYSSIPSQSTDLSYDTVLYPMLEMGQLGINQDSRITRKLIELCPIQSEVLIATGYFNMTKEYAETIIERSKAAFKILMAHPSSNGFFNAKGPAGGIPKGYSELAGMFWDRIQHCQQSARVTLFEYTRPYWTFHSKGLWLLPEREAAPVLTLIGSPNFGERSVHHDLECQFVVTTTNPQLQHSLKEEALNLYAYGKTYTKEERQRRPPLWVRIVLLLFKTYL